MESGFSNERVMKKLLEQMNTALPSKRIPLNELLEKDEPSYKGRDGRDYSIDRRELVLMKKALEESGMPDVRVPIMLFTDTTLDQSAWRVEGAEECAVIAYVLGRNTRQVRSPMYLYLAHMAVVRRTLPTGTVSVFV